MKRNKSDKHNDGRVHLLDGMNNASPVNRPSKLTAGCVLVSSLNWKICQRVMKKVKAV